MVKACKDPIVECTIEEAVPQEFDRSSIEKYVQGQPFVWTDFLGQQHSITVDGWDFVQPGQRADLSNRLGITFVMPAVNPKREDKKYVPLSDAKPRACLDVSGGSAPKWIFRFDNVRIPVFSSVCSRPRYTEMGGDESEWAQTVTDHDTYVRAKNAMEWWVEGSYVQGGFPPHMFTFKSMVKAHEDAHFADRSKQIEKWFNEAFEKISLNRPSQEDYTCPDDALKNIFSLNGILIEAYNEATKEYLVSNLRPYFADTSNPAFSWGRNYHYQEILGFLGHQGAIAGMDTVIRYSKYESHRIEAIWYLATIGRLEYFDILRSLVTDRSSRRVGLRAFILCAKDPRYTDEVKSIVREIIENPQEPAGQRTVAASYLEEVDKAYTVELLDNLFRSTSGRLRSSYFSSLQYCDPDGQVDRVMYAIPREPDEMLRWGYLPSYGSITYGTYSRNFLQPVFVRFLRDWIKNEPPSSGVRVDGSHFLKEFIPLAPAEAVAVSVLLDTLVSYKHESSTCGWIGDRNFVNELDNHLENARKHLARGDSANTYHQVEKFQEKVNKEYERTVENEKKNKPHDKRFVTVDGWKFLYYNAQYILDRLPRQRGER